MKMSGDNCDPLNLVTKQQNKTLLDWMKVKYLKCAGDKLRSCFLK